MAKNLKNSFKSLDAPQIITNFFAAAGYTVITFMGVFALLLVTFSFLDSPIAGMFITDMRPSEPSEATLTPQPHWLNRLLVTLLSIAGIGALLSLPFWFGKYGAKINRWILQKVGVGTTLLTLLSVKVLMIAVPLFLSRFLLQTGVAGVSQEQSHAVLMMLLVLGASAVVLFAIQAVLARLLKVDDQKIW